jgi:hypothetical protein
LIDGFGACEFFHPSLDCSDGKPEANEYRSECERQFIA